MKPKPREQIIAFLQSSSRRYTANQIVQRTGLSFTTVRNTLNRLEDERMVNKELEIGEFGRSVHFWSAAEMPRGTYTNEARAGLANAGDLLSWSRDLLEQVQYSYSLNDCDCRVCAECGEMPTKCSETECSQTCSCSECDGCRISALLAAIDAHAQGVPNDHAAL